MDKHAVTIWPPLETAYTDEFGEIDVEVYRAAGKLWSLGQKYALDQLGDPSSGLRLMINAVANVSRRRAASNEQIENLPAYLFQTYKRLILAELKKENGHRRLETDRASEIGVNDPLDEDVDRKILIEQVIRHMDDWTRDVFRLLVLGHSYEEIGKLRGRNAHALRTKYNKKLSRLRKQIQAGERGGV